MSTMKQYQDPDPRSTGFVAAVFLALMLFVMLIGAFTACSPKIIYQKETVVEYRDRIVHDTARVEIPVEVEKIVTKDTVSHLENTYARSDAMVSQGLLHHSLESKPQIIEVPVEVHVTDTLWKEQEIKTEYVEVEKQLTWWQKMKQDTWWWLVIAVIGLLVWIFRKPILDFIKKLI